MLSVELEGEIAVVTVNNPPVKAIGQEMRQGLHEAVDSLDADETTQADVLATGFSLAKVLGKIPVQAGVCDGFIGNRILKTTRAQAERMLMSGASPADVDRAMRSFGMPMGPFEAQDLGGLDIAAFQRSAARERGETPFAPVAERLVAMERLGQKTIAGWQWALPRAENRSCIEHGVVCQLDHELKCFFNDFQLQND